MLLDQLVDRVLGVLFVSADHTARPAVDPADDILVATALHPTVAMRDGRAFLVERQTRSGHTAIAHRPHDELNRQLLAIAGVLGRDPSILVGYKLLAAEHDALRLAFAVDLDRRCQKPEHHPPVSRTRLLAGVAAQYLDVQLARSARRL